METAPVGVHQVSGQGPLERILRPFQEFANLEASSGILLLLCTLTALVWANSPWAASYGEFWHTKAMVGLGPLVLSNTLLHWINDGLMVIFFFVVGLEIKREVLGGELASVRRAALPIAAALGGMLIPAAIYSAINAGREGAAGWGIPMATDIAFALGVLSLLGKRVPLSLKVFLTALAIADDIGAVLVIAFFYTTEISWFALAAGAAILLLLILANRTRVRETSVYMILGIGLWLAFLQSGIHATIAGVLLAMTIPAHSRINADEFVTTSRVLLDEFARAGPPNQSAWVNEDQQCTLQSLETATEQVETPLQRIEHALHPWVTFVIMPVFALANAGVPLQGNLMTAWLNPISLGVIAGLVVGKQVGISLVSWLAVKSGLASLPEGVTWKQVYGVSWLGGIGFTMSLFIASLAFGDTALLTSAKLGILLASLIAGIVGWVFLARAGRKHLATSQAKDPLSP